MIEQCSWTSWIFRLFQILVRVVASTLVGHDWFSVMRHWAIWWWQKKQDLSPAGVVFEGTYEMFNPSLLSWLLLTVAEMFNSRSTVYCHWWWSVVTDCAIMGMVRTVFVQMCNYDRSSKKFIVFFVFLLGHVNLLSLLQHQQTSFFFFFGVKLFFVCWQVFFSVFNDCFPVAFSSHSPRSAFAKQIPVPFLSFLSKLYFVFDFVPFFSFLTLSFSFVCSKVPRKRTGQSCLKRRDQENSSAGAEGEIKKKFNVNTQEGVFVYVSFVLVLFMHLFKNITPHLGAERHRPLQLCASHTPLSHESG